MNKLNNKSGFTLIEIIVVLIIVGILAAIALPNFYQNVSKSKAQDAFAQFESFKPSFEACLNSHINGETACSSALVSRPASTANVNLSYVTPAAAAGAGVNGLSIYAGTPVTASLAGGNSANDTITLSRTSAGTYTTVCGGAFAGVC